MRALLLQSELGESRGERRRKSKIPAALAHIRAPCSTALETAPAPSSEEAWAVPSWHLLGGKEAAGRKKKSKKKNNWWRVTRKKLQFWNKYSKWTWKVAFALRQFGRKTSVQRGKKKVANTVSGISLAKVQKLGKAQLGGPLCKADGRLNETAGSNAKDEEHSVLYQRKESHFTGKLILQCRYETEFNHLLCIKEFTEFKMPSLVP